VLFKIFVIAPWTAVLLLLLLLLLVLLLLLLLFRNCSFSFETKVNAISQVQGSPEHTCPKFIQKYRLFIYKENFKIFLLRSQCYIFVCKAYVLCEKLGSIFTTEAYKFEIL
jgi:hypothetical protein